MPKLFQIMPCRLEGYKSTLEGFVKTNKFLVSYNDVCNGGSDMLIPSGIADHWGSFFYIPSLAYFFDIGADLASKIFFLSYGLICFAISLYFFNKLFNNKKLQLIGFIVIFFLFFLSIGIGDTYSFYGLTSLALIPVWCYFIDKFLYISNIKIFIFSILSGIMIAFSESVRGQSGLTIIFCLLTYFIMNEKKYKIKKAIIILLILIPSLPLNFFYEYLKEERNNYLGKNNEIVLELNKREISLNHVRSVWHNAYFGLGFLNDDNPNLPKNNDTYAVNFAKKINPLVVPFTAEYEKILRDEYFKIMINEPLSYLKIILSKIAYLLLYILLFVNIGLYFLIKKRISAKVKYFFFPGIAFNCLFGIMAEPYYQYLLGLFVFCSLMTLHILHNEYFSKK
mgnify:CR=1 FL=1